MIFAPNGDILLHQSWIDDANRCPERGRFGIVQPELSGPSDATSLGTAAHAGVECILNEGSVTEAYKMIAEVLDYELSLPNVKWNKYNDRADLLSRAVACFEVWLSDILPMLPQPGAPEVNFKVKVFTTAEGRDVFIEGQIDYVPLAENLLWDWKFPGREYKQAEKQKTAIQPTIYTLAAVLGGLEHVTDFKYSYPMDFTYGIGVTFVKAARAQVFTVERNQNHADFAIHRIKGWVDLATKFGLENSWPLNDDNYLCSDKWCSWYAQCKGQFLHWSEGAVPVRLQVAKAA